MLRSISHGMLTCLNIDQQNADGEYVCVGKFIGVAVTLCMNEMKCKVHSAHKLIDLCCVLDSENLFLF